MFGDIPRKQHQHDKAAHNKSDANPRTRQTPYVLAALRMIDPACVCVSTLREGGSSCRHGPFGAPNTLVLLRDWPLRQAFFIYIFTTPFNCEFPVSRLTSHDWVVGVSLNVNLRWLVKAECLLKGTRSNSDPLLAGDEPVACYCDNLL